VAIGVDWNGHANGNPIIVVAFYPDSNSYVVVDKYISKDKELTQLTAVSDLISMANKWNPHYIYVDSGYGNVQLEMLKKYAMDTNNTTFLPKLKGIHMQSKAEIRDPITKKKIEKQNKALMIDLAVQRVEHKMCFFPHTENEKNELVDQLRNFKIDRYTPTGIPIYSQGEDHQLVAWALAMYALTMEFSDIAKITDSGVVGFLPPEVSSKSLTGNKPSQSDNPFATMNIVRSNSDMNRKIEDPEDGYIRANSNFRTKYEGFARRGSLRSSTRALGRRSF
jgi:hypothetical protein